LLIWPEAAATGGDWRLRISRADITRDGPFSAFPGVARWFAVLEGAGVVLHFFDGARTLKVGDAPLSFDGAAAPGCSLVSGATQDLNLMVRGGSGCMEPVTAGLPWNAGHTMQGLYTASGGLWTDGLQKLSLPAHTLLWCAEHEDRPWSFEPAKSDGATPSYWLGFTPLATATQGNNP
jgi:environmental stress-induced protein Ves